MDTPKSKEQFTSLTSTGPDSVRTWARGYILHHRSQHHSPNTIRFYQVSLDHLAWFLENFEHPTHFGELRADHFREFLAYLHETGSRWGSNSPRATKPLKITGVSAYARAVRAFCRWVSDETGLPNPFMGVRMPKIPNEWKVEHFTTEEIALLFVAADRSGNHFSSTRNRAILATLLDTGLRAAELLDMQTTDLDEERGSFRVVGKGRKERMVIMGHYAREQMWNYLVQRSRVTVESGPVWLTEQGTPLTYWGLSMVFRRLRARSGITRVPVRPHVCRHTFASQAHRNGLQAADLQELLGHANFDTTRKYYLGIEEDELMSAATKASPLDNLPHSPSQPFLSRGKRLPLPSANKLAAEVAKSNYREVGRRYGVSDTTIRNHIRKGQSL